MDAEEKEIQSLVLVEQITRMTDESETSGGFTWEDACATLNSLIAAAREISGIDPGHPHVYCAACGVNRDECSCDEEEEDEE
jgi:hypothetical protein